MTNRITGILTPHITPVDSQGRVDEDRLCEYIDWLIERGVDGLYPNGSTGEFVRFTPEERRRIIRVVVDHTAGRVPILAGAAEANVKETIAACDAYGEMGVRAVAIVAPFYYRLSSEGVYAYFKEIADTVSVDVTLYNIPMFASPIDLPTIIRLAQECPRVIGIKDSSGDLPLMMRMIAAIRPLRDDFSFLTGWDAALVPML
ncbi:dihydrodipicolinate synthase, partial [Rhodopirellula maiorica SM1]